HSCFVLPPALGPTPFTYTTLFRSQANLVNSLNEDAGTFQVAAIIGYGVGGAAIATGFVLWIVDMNKQKKSAGLQPSAEPWVRPRSEEHTSELQSRENLVCRPLHAK